MENNVGTSPGASIGCDETFPPAKSPAPAEASDKTWKPAVAWAERESSRKSSEFVRFPLALSGVQNVETSIVLSQVALERLACTYIVDSRTQKKKLPKAKSITDQLRVLLNDLRIPTLLSNDLDEGMAKGEPSSHLDGPATFVEMRNRVAHLRGSLLATPLSNRRQAKDLGLWYLELVLLSLFGYRGQHCNRLLDHRSGGRWEVVPWAKT